MHLSEVKIEVTYKCNLNCWHCSSEASSENFYELSLDQCKQIIFDSVELGANQIAFSGGEPFLWPHLYDSILYAKSLGCKVFVYTNGCSKDVADKISSYSPNLIDKIIFSIYGSTDELHSRVTGKPGSLHETLLTASLVFEQHINIEAHFVPFKINYFDLENVSSFLSSRNFSGLSILRFVPQGRGVRNGDMMLGKKENLELKSTLGILAKTNNLINIRVGSPYNFLLTHEYVKCTAGATKITVKPNLDVIPCDAFKAMDFSGVDKFENNLQYNSLRSIFLKSNFFNMIRSLSNNIPAECEKCNRLNLCGSGCLAQKILYSNISLPSRDPLCLLD